MGNPLSSFSLTIGRLEFGSKSLSYILLAFFLMGILAGLYSIIFIKNPGISDALIIPLFAGFVPPVIILVKGIQQAKEITHSSAE